MNNLNQNPFFRNYLFTLKDLIRPKIKWWQHPLIYLRPTYSQIGTDCNYVFHFKIGSRGEIYLMNVEQI